MEVLLAVLLVVFAVAVVAAPLRPGRTHGRDSAHGAELEALTAARDAKYREIREAEMDWRTGKLGEADYRELDRRLRREAIDLLKELDGV